MKADNFWKYVDKSGGPDTCWHWKRALHNEGYGLVWLDHKRLYSHRASWELVNGPIPNDLCVLHKCDNPICCNPKHLFLGTPLDNAQDRSRKGRTSRKVSHSGEKSPNHELTTSDVIKMREQYASGKYSCADLALIYPVCTRHINDIINRERWAYI